MDEAVGIIVIPITLLVREEQVETGIVLAAVMAAAEVEEPLRPMFLDLHILGAHPNQDRRFPLVGRIIREAVLVLTAPGEAHPTELAQLLAEAVGLKRTMQC